MIWLVWERNGIDGQFLVYLAKTESDAYDYVDRHQKCYNEVSLEVEEVYLNWEYRGIGSSHV